MSLVPLHPPLGRQQRPGDWAGRARRDERGTIVDLEMPSALGWIEDGGPPHSTAAEDRGGGGGDDAGGDSHAR